MAGAAAGRLDNTPAEARASCIHPAVQALAEPEPDDRLRHLAARPGPALAGLRAGEAALIGFIEG